MRAVTYQGPNQVKVAEVEDAKLEKKDDIVIKITSTAICGSDLHLYQGSMPLPHGYIIGHEPMGIVEEVGPDVTKVKKGDRVIIPFNVACGQCAYCQILEIIVPLVIQRTVLDETRHCAPQSLSSMKRSRL